MIGRPPKPTALKKLAGNPGKRPLNENEPQFTALSAPMRPPTTLNKEGKREWKRISQELHNAGLLTLVDRAALTGYCQAWAHWVEAEEKLQTDGRVLTTDKGYAYVSPWVGIANTALDQMRRFMSEFGMTPASRTRIKVDKQEGEKTLAEILFESVETGNE